MLEITVKVIDGSIPGNIGAVGAVTPQGDPSFRFASLVLEAIERITKKQGVAIAEQEEVEIFFPQSNEAILLTKPKEAFEQLTLR